MPPAPKRSSQRRRVNKTPGLQESFAAAHVTVPDPDPTWHPVARDWYLSLNRSGQAKFYEDSDWLLGYAAAGQLSTCMTTPNAALFGRFLEAARELLATEASRRRARLELIRVTNAEEKAQEEARSHVADIVALAGA